MNFAMLEEQEAVEFQRQRNAKRTEKLTSIIQNELTPRQREVVTKVLLEDRTMESVAQELSVCRSTIFRTYHRGMRKLSRYAKYID